MTAAAGGFDGLARWYRLLEGIAFGRVLARARYACLGHLVERRRILVIGEGDGRALARIVGIAPEARITCVDASAAMLARARARLSNAAQSRIEFLQADIRACAWPAASFDAVVTLFVLDCFTAPEVAALVERLSPALTADSIWLFSDFALPRSGLARLRARLWLALLYAFFRRCAGISARHLPDSERILERAGFSPIESQRSSAGLFVSAAFAFAPRHDRQCGGYVLSK
jgi:SAM-dependent methyltransferase